MTIRAASGGTLLSGRIMQRLYAKPACKDARSVMLDVLDTGEPLGGRTIHSIDTDGGGRDAYNITLGVTEAELRPGPGTAGCC